MKTRLNICFIVAFYHFLSLPLISQGILKGFEINFAYLIEPQDRRLFEYPHPETLINIEKSSFDFQYDFYINKNILKKKKLNIYSGIGYSVHINKFDRPFEHGYFDGTGSFEARFIRRYSIHRIKLVNTFKYNLITHSNGQERLSVIIPFNLNIALNKNIVGEFHEYKANKWRVEFNNFEIYSGLSYRIGKFEPNIAYRIFNLQKIDPVIFNSILFDFFPDFLKMKNEIYNLNKIMFGISYQF